MVTDHEPSQRAVRPPSRMLTPAIRARLHPVMLAYIDGIFLRGRDRTAVTAGEVLTQYHRWTQEQALDPLRVTREHLEAYQSFLVATYRTSAGKPLARSTAQVRIGCLKGWYRWLTDQGHLVADPAKSLGIRVVVSRVVRTEHLSLQEATALVQTQAAVVAATPPGTRSHARALLDLAAICMALATGRRISGIATMTVAGLDLDRAEVRIEREKGHAGRVLPVAGWAVEVVRAYLQEGRPLLVPAGSPWLFANSDGTRPMLQMTLARMLRGVVAATIRANPDLTDLPGKRVSWHSLWVSFATLLFQNGCDIRSVNELLLHRRLSTTAKYTPVPVEDLRQIFRTAHPRA
jgi:integrase/recombinase XerD